MIGSDPIDQIWNELKENCSLPSLNKVITKKKNTKTCKDVRKSRKKKDILQSILCNDSATSHGNTPGDIISTSDQRAKRSYSYTCTWNEKILLNLNGCTCSLEVNDSDDDDEEEEEEENPSVSLRDDKPIASLFTIEKKYNEELVCAWRMGRFPSALQSDVGSDRLEALNMLNIILDELHLALPPVPKLNFPLPYHPDQVALFHKRESLVSDLATKSHDSKWSSEWQRTFNSLSGIVTADPCEATPANNYKKKNTNQILLRTKIQAIFDHLAIHIFRRLNDRVEKCRELALKCLITLSLHAMDVGKHISYFVRSLLLRLPPTAYDSDLNVFVHDFPRHEAFKRGVATERQDRGDLIGYGEVKVIECCEENRLLLCGVIEALIRGSVARRSVGILLPYASDLIQALYCLQRDRYPKLKEYASCVIMQTLRLREWETITKQVATGFARAALANLRHNKASVRVSALDVFEASVSVPNREKVKGAGSEAIVDLVGFQEENILPVGVFYERKYGLSVNILAELTSDKNVSVRRRCCSVLNYFVTCLPDRYDHHQRLLPHILSFFNDKDESIRNQAIKAVDKCGEQYEIEHAGDLIEKRQYAVDGDYDCCNLMAPLPEPFTTRPRLGSRMFVRSNVKRLAKVLAEELSNWSSTVREKSAKVLCTVIVYCEDSLTTEFDQIFSSTLKALITEIRDVEGEKQEQFSNILNSLELIFLLMGRFVNPKTYLPFLVPRIRGDNDSGTTYAEGGSHSASSRLASVIALQALMQGTLPQVLEQSSCEIIDMLTSESCTGEYIGSKFKQKCIETLVLFIKLTMSYFSKPILEHEKLFHLKSFLLQFENDMDIEIRNVVKSGLILFL